MNEKLDILINKKSLLDDFIRLNEQWITTYFELEESDRRLAADPESIIDNGGFVFSLVFGSQVIGVCALFNEGNGVYQLARMAITPRFHGRGHGHLLMRACLDTLEEINARKVYLITNSKLSAAMALYAKHDFVTVREGQHPIYARANVTMERIFS
ncbi:MAG: GNAT family N-acetyltransferase [Pseudomonadota bacterium]